MINSLTRPLTSPLCRAITDAGVALTRIIEKFETLTGWTLVDTGPDSNIAVTTGGEGVFAPEALRFTSNAVAGSNTYVTKNLTIDLSAAPGFWLLARTKFRQNGAGIGMTAYMANGANLTTGTGGRWQSTALIQSYAVGLQPHWVPKSAFSTLDGTPTFASPVLSVRFRIDSSAEAHDWELLGITQERTRPCVVVTQDDGWASSYTIAFPACQSRSIPQSHYLISSLIGTGGYITLSQAQEMRAAGDYLGLHGVVRWDTNTALIASDKAGLVALGIDTQHAAYPEGRIGDGTTWEATKSALIAASVKTARLTGGAVSTPTLHHRADPHCISSYPLNNSITLAQAQAAVDTAIASGGTVFFYGHKYGATSDSLTWTTADFTALLDYIVTKRAAGLIDTKTIEQWWGA